MALLIRPSRAHAAIAAPLTEVHSKHAVKNVALEPSPQREAPLQVWVIVSEPGVKNLIFQLFTFTIKIERDLVEIDPDTIILKNLASE